MNKKGLLVRTAVGVVGSVMLIGVAGAAIAEEIGEGEDVSVNVEITPEEPIGALTMSVASNATSLTEGEAPAEGVRQFNGELPTVTVTDDREVVPEGVFWYVTGQSSSFATTAGDTITADHLGWAPRLITEAPAGEVAEGPVVDTVIDGGANGVGLTGEELLALTLDSGDARPTGSWSANADLFLKTPSDVAPGSYSATITLSLWEDVY